MSKGKLAALVVAAMLACGGLAAYTLRERPIQVRLTGQVAPLPPVPEGQEPDRVEIEVWFPELRLLMAPDGLHSHRDGVSRARVQPARIGDGLRYRARLAPDGSYEVELTFRGRQLPTVCTVSFSREGYVTRRLRSVPLQLSGDRLVGTGSDPRPYKARRPPNTD